MEKPTTEEVGRVDLEVEESPEAGRSKDAQDFLRTGGADVGTGAVEVDAAGGVGVEVSADGEGATVAGSGTSTERIASVLATAMALVVTSLDSGLGLVCEEAVPVADTDVFEESGETGTGGVSDTFEISVPQEDTVSGSCKSLRGDSAEPTVAFSGSSGAGCVDKSETTATLDNVTGLMATGFGDPGGVGSRRAFSTMSGGGRELGEMMIPGARDGSVGRRDQMAQPPSCGFG